MYHNYTSSSVSSLTAVSKPVEQHTINTNAVLCLFVCLCKCVSMPSMLLSSVSLSLIQIIHHSFRPPPPSSPHLSPRPLHFSRSPSPTILSCPCLHPPPLLSVSTNTHPYTQQPACTNTNGLVLSYSVFVILSLFFSVFVFIKSRAATIS